MADDATLQWLRKCSLIVSAGDKGLDLSLLRIRFKIFQCETGPMGSPNHTYIRVYNLSPETAKSVQKEYTRVVLQAGYETGSFGIIFDGTIKYVRRGRETPTDTYLDILAADGDLAYNFSTINQSLAAGSTPDDQMRVYAKSMNLPVGYQADLPKSALSRGKVMYGMTRNYVDGTIASSGKTWTIQNGKINVIDLKGYLPGEAVVLNSNSGMIGLPEQTEEGIKVRCLLNPRIRIGALVHIDNSSVQRSFLLPASLYAPGRLDDPAAYPNMFPKVSDDGFYRVYVCEYEGDTRGEAWYCDLTCLAIDRSAAPSNSVKAAT